MEPQVTAGVKLRWALAGLTGLLLVYGLLLAALASRASALLPADARSWVMFCGGLW